MKAWCSALCACLLTGALTAEVVIEYDAERHGYPDGLEKLDPESIAEGVCIMAEAQRSMGEVDDFRFFGQLYPFPIRYAVVGDEKRSVTIKPIPSDHLETASFITVVMGRKSITAFELSKPEPGVPPKLPDEVVEMGQKLDKIDAFNRLIKASMAKSKAAGEVPRAVLVVNSETPFGKMVDTLKLIQATGCEHGLVMMSGHFAAAFNIRGKMDPEVKPPIARNSMPQENEEGRIVVNVRNNGTYTADDFTVLPDLGAIEDYVKKAREEFEPLGIEPRLHLRGDKEALFKHCRIAIRAAAKAGVHQVLFATYIRRQDDVDEPPEQAEPQERPRAVDPRLFVEGHRALIFLLEPREFDLGFWQPDPAAKPGKAPEIEPLRITIRDDGSILANDKFMDMDDTSRELPQLDALVKFYREGVDAVGESPHVKVYYTSKATHQRVIDVLNSLAGVGIHSVTFRPAAEKKKWE